MTFFKAVFWFIHRQFYSTRESARYKMPGWFVSVGQVGVSESPPSLTPCTRSRVAHMACPCSPSIDSCLALWHAPHSRTTTLLWTFPLPSSFSPSLGGPCQGFNTMVAGLSVGFWVAGSVHKVGGCSKACTLFNEGMEGCWPSFMGGPGGASPRKFLPKMIFWNAIWAYFQQTLCKSVHPNSLLVDAG